MDIALIHKVFNDLMHSTLGNPYLYSHFTGCNLFVLPN